MSCHAGSRRGARVGSAADHGRVCGAGTRGPRAVHLHLRNHRAAQGRQRQPLPHDAVEPLVRRHDGYPARATACTTACRCITASAAWWPSVRCSWAAARSCCAKILGERNSGATSWPSAARCSSTSASCAAILLQCAGMKPPKPSIRCALLRQRPARGRLGGIPDALSDSADPRVLRGDRGQLLALQLRGPAAAPIGRIPAFLAHRAARGAGEVRLRDRRAGAQCARVL